MVSVYSMMLLFSALKCMLFLGGAVCCPQYLSLWCKEWNNVAASRTLVIPGAAYEPLVLWHYIRGRFLFEKLRTWITDSGVLPHGMGGSCCCRRQPSFFKWFLAFFLYIPIFIFIFKVFRAFQDKPVQSFLAPVFTISHVPVLQPSAGVNSVQWGQEALTEQVYLGSMCSSSFLPCKPKNQAVLPYTAGSSVMNSHSHVEDLGYLCRGGHWVTAEATPLLQKRLPTCVWSYRRTAETPAAHWSVCGWMGGGRRKSRVRLRSLKTHSFPSVNIHWW